MPLHGITVFLLLAFVLIVLTVLWRAVLPKRPASFLGMLPSEVMDEIGRAPVLEQTRAGKVYLGAKVRWQVTFESAIPLSPLSVRLMLQDRGEFPWVLCDVHTRKFPQLRGLVQHAPLWVTGQISRITPDEIVLKNVLLEFGS